MTNDELRNFSLINLRFADPSLTREQNVKKIRDDRGYWNQIEFYIRAHSEAEFSHSICPECAHKPYHL